MGTKPKPLSLGRGYRLRAPRGKTPYCLSRNLGSRPRAPGEHAHCGLHPGLHAYSAGPRFTRDLSLERSHKSSYGGAPPIATHVLHRVQSAAAVIAACCETAYDRLAFLTVWAHFLP